jgi:hypothetical protein
VLSVFWRVEGWLCEYEDALFRVASQVVEDRPVPEPLHFVPSPDNTTLNWVQFGCLGGLTGDIADVKVESFGDFFIAEHEILFADVFSLRDKRGNVEGRLHVASVSHFGVACAVVDDYEFSIHLVLIYLI